MPRETKAPVTVAALPAALDLIEARGLYVLDKLESALEEQRALLRELATIRGERKLTVRWSPGTGYYDDEDHDAAQRDEPTRTFGPTE